MPNILNFLKESVYLWLEISPYLLLGMLIAGIIHSFLGKEFISRHLGRGGFISIIKAVLFGVPLPVCSCGVIPLASSLEKDGAHRSSVLSFLVSTPTTGVDSILATYSLMGPLFAVFRPLGAVISGITVGITDYLVSGRKKKSASVRSHTHKEIKISFKMHEVLRFGFYEIPQDIGKWLILGVLLGGFISAVFPKDLFARFFSFPWDFLVAFMVGIPLYVCATGSIPIAVSLISTGFSPGAALIFLIVGPATNAITLSFVRAKLGRRSFYLYLASIVITALVLGLIFNFIWQMLGKDQSLLSGAGKFLPLSLKISCGIILLALIFNALLKGKGERFSSDWEVYVPDIHCKHCKMAIEAKLKGLEGAEKVAVILDRKIVKVKGKVSKDKVLDKIREAGYHPQSY